MTHLLHLLSLVCAVATQTIFTTTALSDQPDPPLQQPHSCYEHERRALLQFKRGLDDTLNILSSWTTQDSGCCHWRGVGCHNTTGRVTLLDLRPDFEPNNIDVGALPGSVSYSPMGGKIGPSLLNLTHLSHLDLSCNSFTTIPNFIGSLSHLTYLNLSSNSIEGTIPAHIGNLSRLLVFDLSDNFYGIDIDNLDWVSRLSSLQVLKLTEANFSRAINWVQVIRSHPSLSSLYLDKCYFPELDPASLIQTNSSNSLRVLHLTSSSLLPPAALPLLLNLSRSLVDLNLLYNKLRGPLPDAFHAMPNLESLNLFENQLQGGLPKSLGDLCRLKTLDLSWNNLSDPLPLVLRNLGGCARDSLEDLLFSRNQLHGSLPDITRFSKLETLYLDENKLDGRFPDNFGQLSTLKVLNLRSNQLTGQLPDFSRLSSLTVLNLENNRLEGPLPEGIGQMSNLEFLDISSNSLDGFISERHLLNLSKLLYLKTSFNNLSVNFSADWVPPFQLNAMQMRSCKLGPRFPSWLQTQKNYSHLDISNSGISDVAPISFWSLPSDIRYLNLSFNSIGGIVPDLSTELNHFPSVDLSSNLFYGSIPKFLSNSTVLDLSRNMFSGSLSFLCGKTNDYLQYLDLSHNLLSGRVPQCWMDFPNLIILNLENNTISGSIPTSVGSLTRIESLRLRRNSFTGKLPLSLRNCTELKLLDLGENNLSGHIPNWLGQNLRSLLVLRLRSNHFSGSIPGSICQPGSLQILDLALNNISESIPACIRNFTALARKGTSNSAIGYGFYYYDTIRDSLGFRTIGITGGYFDYGYVVWKGVERQYGKTLGLLKIIDLSCNNLSGQIPEGVASLVELITLNLSSNDMTGSIPREIGQLKQLESLDLSRNKLSGEIPGSLATLSYLSYLNLSSNLLSGRIPRSTQLQSFNESSYTMNRELCGAPLPNKCAGDETLQTERADVEKEEAWLEGPWFYIGTAAGVFSGFWAVLGASIFNRVKNGASFQLMDKSAGWLYEKIATKQHKESSHVSIVV